MSTITKMSYARGIAQGLQANGHTQFNSTEAMKYAADSACQHLTSDPGTEDVHISDVAKVASAIIAINDNAHAQYKTASVEQLAYFSNDDMDADMMYKIAHYAEDDITKLAGNQAGTLVGSGPQDNSIANAARQSQMGAAEAKARPENYGLVGQGNANFSEDAAARIGHEMPHPGQQPHKGKGGNSVIDASKSASILANLNKLAGGTNQHGASPTMGQGDNSIHNAAEHSQMAAAEATRRPEAYANVGQGNANFSEPASARIGDEMPHPHAESHGGAASNSVTEASKSASWDRHFSELSNQIGPTLQAMGLSVEDRAYTVKHAMQIEPARLPAYLGQIATQLGFSTVPQPKVANIQNILGEMLV